MLSKRIFPGWAGNPLGLEKIRILREKLRAEED